MRAELLDLMRIVSNGIVAEELVADQIEALVSEALELHEDEIAAALRVIGRYHHIRLLELKGRLAALSKKHDDIQ